MSLSGPFMFDPRAFWGDEKVKKMTGDQIAIYIRALSLQWENGSIPDDADELAILLTEGRRQYTAESLVGSQGSLSAPLRGSLWAPLKGCFRVPEGSPGRLENPRQAEGRALWLAKQRKASEDGKRGVEAKREKARLESRVPSGSLKGASRDPQAGPVPVPVPSEERRVSSRLVGVAEPTADESPEKQAMTPEQIKEADREFEVTAERIAENLEQAKERTEAEISRLRLQQARKHEMVWRINECWKAHLAQREKHWQDVEHRANAPGRPPTLTKLRKKLIAEAILRLDQGLMGAEDSDRCQWMVDSKARAAGIGLFLDTWLTAEREGNELHNGGRRFLEPERAWKIIKGVDNAERFAELYFEAKERQNE